MCGKVGEGTVMMVAASLWEPMELLKLLPALADEEVLIKLGVPVRREEKLGAVNGCKGCK